MFYTYDSDFSILDLLLLSLTINQHIVLFMLPFSFLLFESMQKSVAYFLE